MGDCHSTGRPAVVVDVDSMQGHDLKVAIDYDDTWTRDPVAWGAIVTILQAAGHGVYCVTKRYPEQAQDVVEAMRPRQIPIIYSPLGEAKDTSARMASVVIDVWIEDKPEQVKQRMMHGKPILSGGE